MKSLISRSEEETEQVGQDLARELEGSGLVLLEGDLGAGKTVLVRGMARALGLDPREVQSPTYTLVHEYESAQTRLVHVDLYRLDPHEVDSLGLEELLDGPGLKAIEWAERLWGDVTPSGAVRVKILSSSESTREIRLTKKRKETE